MSARPRNPGSEFVGEAAALTPALIAEVDRAVFAAGAARPDVLPLTVEQARAVVDRGWLGPDARCHDCGVLVAQHGDACG